MEKWRPEKSITRASGGSIARGRRSQSPALVVGMSVFLQVGGGKPLAAFQVDILGKRMCLSLPNWIPQQRKRSCPDSLFILGYNSLLSRFGNPHFHHCLRRDLDLLARSRIATHTGLETTTLPGERSVLFGLGDRQGRHLTKNR